MLISCNCLNFVATSPQLQCSLSNASPEGPARGSNINNNNSNSVTAGLTGKSAWTSLLEQKFVQEYPRDFIFYNKFIDFFKHAIGPIPDLTVNAISQRVLMYCLTLDVSDQSWQLSICINCKVVLCAKRLIAGAGATPTHYLINSTLLCSSEELAHRRNHKSYSETFDLLIMDRGDVTGGTAKSVVISPQSSSLANSASTFSIGSISANTPTMDGKLQRLRQLQVHQQERLQAEINETNESIERYTEQKFALLKSFREKCDQEAALLTRLIQQIPDQACELLDRAMPVALEVTGGVINYAAGPGARRRNTISSRRELGLPTTPTTPLVQPPSFLTLTQDTPQQQPKHVQQQQPQLPSASIITTRKLSNFDTPPATPEATPMSVGNSPTFRQQQQQQQQQQSAVAANNTLLLSTPTASTGPDDADDCLFDLEDVDGTMQTQPAQTFVRAHIYQQQQQHQQHYPRLQLHNQQQSQQQQLDNMSDADEAEDALDLDTSLPIPMRGPASGNLAFANFARSLPVEIANSPLAERANNNHLVIENGEVVDNTVDIAASIKALAKSVRGEAVFGDLPRPRLRSQI